MNMNTSYIILFVTLACSCKCQDTAASNQTQVDENPEQALKEGSKCWVGKVNGTCINMYRCPSAATYYAYIASSLRQAVARLQEPQECFRREDGELFVCCTDCYLDDKEEYRRKVPLVLGVKVDKGGSKAWRKCIEYFQKLPYPCHGLSSNQFSIQYVDSLKCNYMQTNSFGIGGYAAGKWQFPHMALLGYGPRREDAQWLCGGSVISERYILTAAHCSSHPQIGPITFAGLGVLTRSELTDYWKIYKIKTIIPHPEYRPPSKYHDIALLETDTEINFGKGLLPACLSLGYKPTWVEAPGWGRLGHRGRLAEHLMVMELELYNDTQCAAMFPKHRLLKRGYDNTTQMCYGRQDKVVDTCEGDSGGPLHRDESLCMYYVVGVTSYGRDCGVLGNAAMYTRVEHYLPWLESIVWPDPA